jgi:phage gp16-like protein
MGNKYPTRYADRRKELAQIHMAAQQLGMDTSDKDENSEYRSMLFTVARVRSSADLDYAGRTAVLAHLKSRGAKLGGKRPGQAHKQLAQDKAAIERKIGALLKQLDADWPYAYGTAKRIFPDVARFEFLTVEQMGKVASALERTVRFRKEKAK